MEFGNAFSFPFSDQDWIKKIGIIALVSLIPIIGQMVLLGWAFQITRQIIKNEGVHLPELNFSEQLTLGFKGFVIGLVFSLPGMIFQIPIHIVGPITSGTGFDEQSLSWLVIAIGICCGGFQLIYSLIASYLLPAAYANFLAKDSLGAGFHLGEIIGLVKAAPVAYLLVLLGGILCFFIGMAGLIACIIGVFVTMTYSQAVLAHLTGQAYREAQAVKVA